MRNRKPAAKRLRKQITSEVPPTIRKTGTYILLAMHPAQTLEQRQQKDTIHIKAKWLNMDDTWVCNHLPVVFHIAKWQDILYEHLPLIPELIKSKQEAVHQFYATMMEMKGCFACECLDRDFFWMPSIKTKSCRQLKHSVILSLKVNWFVRADEVKVKQVNESSC